MRSAREILFRVRQESANLWLAAARPSIDVEPRLPFRQLPQPMDIARRLRGSPVAEDIERTARRVLDGDIPLLGFSVQAAHPIPWRRDAVSGIETGLDYFRRIPYLDAARAGDHKVIWELNRHQHLVLLAQAYAVSSDAGFVRAIETQLRHWMEANPFQRGINWTSALEVGFRALSWLWILHLAGEVMDADLRRRMAVELYRHGLHLEFNLSVYFSPNTHLLGEAVALHAIGTLCPEFPRAERWRQLAGRIVAEQMFAQMRPDGSHFEQSSYYHVYAVDFFVFHALLAEAPAEYRARLERAAEYLRALHTDAGVMPFLGDDDGGRLFYPYGDRRRFGRATLATCAAMFNRPDLAVSMEDADEQAAWWLADFERAPAPLSREVSVLFPDAGVAAMRASGVHVLMDAGPFGVGGAGHSHSDALAITVHDGDRELLIDAGTYTYVGDAGLRSWFRGSAAHNTVRVDGRDQAVGVGPFRWRDKPDVRVLDWRTSAECDELAAECRYGGVVMRRRCRYLKPDRIWILDEIEGPPGEHDVEQFWHAAGVARADGGFDIAGWRLMLSQSGAVVESAWRSPAFGRREEVPVVVLRLRAALPVRLGVTFERGEGSESGARFLKQLRFR